MGNTTPTREYLCALAEKAGLIAEEHFQVGVPAVWKEDETPITIADQQINDLVVGTIEADYPHIKVIGEEGCGGADESDWTILCDPIDGTIPYAVGAPISSVVLSLLHNDKPVSAAIHDPIYHGTWSAESGHGSFLNGKRVAVSTQKTLTRSNVCMVWWKGCPYNMHAVAGGLMEACVKTCNPMSIAYFGGLVASGDIEATVFPGSNAWETAAMQVLVEEAGGRVTDIHGNPMRYRWENGYLVMDGHVISNDHVHDEIIEIISSHQ